MEQISQEELEKRVSLLKKFKSLLEQQKAKFTEYLKVLEKQEISIENEDSEKLIAHTELEQQVLQNIMNLQKVIIPMSELYHNQNLHSENSIKEIQNDLSDLQQKVLIQNQKNRDLLKNHIFQIRKQIEGIKNPYKTGKNVYTQKSTVGSLVSVEI